MRLILLKANYRLKLLHIFCKQSPYVKTRYIFTERKYIGGKHIRTYEGESVLPLMLIMEFS